MGILSLILICCLIYVCCLIYGIIATGLWQKVVATFCIAIIFIIFIIVYAAPAIGSLEGAGLTSSLFPAYQSPQQQAPINPPAIQNANLYGLTQPSQAGTSPQPGTTIPSGTPSTPQPNNQIEKLLTEAIYRYTVNNTPDWIRMHGQAVSDPNDPNFNPTYARYENAIKNNWKVNGQYDPLQIAPALFPNKEEASLFKKYSQAMININTEVNKANYGVATVFPKGLSPEGTASKEIIKHQVENLISDVDGPGTGESVSGEIDRALLLGNKNDMAGRLDAIIQKHAPKYTEILKKIGIQ